MAARIKKPQSIVVMLQDTREQRPLVFPDNLVEVTTLKVGDYSLRVELPDGNATDYRDRISIERKSLSDLYGCIGQSRERFERELERLSQMERACIVIEATLAEVLAGCPMSEVRPRAAVGSLFAWFARYGVPPIFAGSRELAAAAVRKILVKFAEVQCGVKL